MPNLICLKGADRGEDWELPMLDIDIGRSPQNFIVVHDLKASRQHCKLIMGESTIKLVDLKSRNGTKIEGKPVTEQILKYDQFFQIGDTLFIISQKSLRARVADILGLPEDQVEMGGRKWHEILWDDLTRPRNTDALRNNSLTKFLQDLREDQATEDATRIITAPQRPKLSVRDLQQRPGANGS